VAIVGERGSQETESGRQRAFRDLHQTALRSTAPGLVIAVTPPTSPAGAAHPESHADLPELLSDRPTIAGEPAAYVCRGFVCQAPTTDLTELAAELG